VTFRVALCALLVAVGGLASDWFAVRFDAPAYPPLANQARIEGVVRLRLVLDGQGKVERAEVLSGNPVLARAAQINIMTWKFMQPCSKETSPTTIEFTFEFRLEGETSDVPTTRFRYEHRYRATVTSQARHWVPEKGGGE